jgi:hypothetical protein
MSVITGLYATRQYRCRGRRSGAVRVSCENRRCWEMSYDCFEESRR